MKTLKCFFLLIPFLFSGLISTAQIDNPIAGDVLKLMDLLQKDYTLLSPEIKVDELRKDRAEVIGVFKKYMSKEEEKKIKFDTINELQLSLKDEEEKVISLNDSIQTLEEAMRLFEGLAINDTSVAQEILKKSNSLKKFLIDKKECEHKVDSLQVEIDKMHLSILKNAFSNNNYINHEIETFITKNIAIEKGRMDSLVAEQFSTTTQKSLPFIGGNFDLKTLIDGLSRFIADRIKAELTSAFISKVQNWIEESDDENLMAFQLLMPKTTSYLLSFEANDLNYFSSTIKDNLEVDFNHLVSNIGSLRKIPSIQFELQNNPELEFAFEAVEFIPQLKKIAHPNEFFIFLNNSSLVKEWSNEDDQKKKNIANGIKFTTLMANSLAVKDANAIRFINLQEISKHYKDPNFFMLFFGLLEQQNKKYYKVEFNDKKLSDLLGTLSDTKLTPDILKEAPHKVNFLFEKLTNISNESQKLADRIREIKKASKLEKPIGKDTIIQLMANFVDFFKSTSQNIDEIANSLESITGKEFTSQASKNLASYLDVAEQSISILDNLFHKRYANAVIGALEIIPLIHHSNGNEINIISKIIDGALAAPTLKNTYDTLTLGTPYAINSALSEKMKNMSQKLSEVMVTAYESEEKGLENTITLLKKAHKDLTRISKLDRVDGQDANGVNFKILFADSTFKKLFVKQQYGVIEWKELGKKTCKTLKGIKVNKRSVFDKNELKKLNAKLDSLYDDVFDHIYFEKSDSLKSFKNYFLAFSTNPLIESINKELAINPKLKRLIYFINDISNAQDAEQVKSAIENFTLPVGSYSIKQKSSFDLSIGTTPGGLWTFKENLNNDTLTVSNGIAFTAPVGLSISTGLLRGHSVGFFVPIIDIGALTHFRFNSENDSETLPEVNLRNIMALGVHLQFGLKNTPLIFSCGWQMGPQIRTVDASSSDGFTSINSSRWSVGLRIDIPIFNVYTSPK